MTELTLHTEITPQRFVVNLQPSQKRHPVLCRHDTLSYFNQDNGIDLHVLLPLKEHARSACGPAVYEYGYDASLLLTPHDVHAPPHYGVPIQMMWGKV